MSFHLPRSAKLARLAVVGISALGIAGSAAASAQATTCGTLEKKYADRDITHVSTTHREQTGFCLAVDARKANGVTATIKNSSKLQLSARRHAVVSTQLKWWGGVTSHIEPSQGNISASDAIAQRIANAGFCANGTPDTNENTYTAWGNGANTPTLRGAVNWWLSDPPHRQTLLSTEYKYVGIGAIAAIATPDDSGDAQAITVVADFGSCN